MGKSLQHAAMALPRGYLFGLILSTAGSSTTFTTAAGEAVDDAGGTADVKPAADPRLRAAAALPGSLQP